MTLNKILVCGIGNRLKRDDGIGPYIIEELEDYSLPSHVNAIDIGISAFKTALLIGKYHKVIFIDAIKKGRQAGHVYRIYLHKDQFISKPSLDSFVFSFHESNLDNILTTANLLDNFPGEVILLGCEPKITSTGLGLSKEVMKSVKHIIDLIFHEIQS